MEITAGGMFTGNDIPHFPDDIRIISGHIMVLMDVRGEIVELAILWRTTSFQSPMRTPIISVSWNSQYRNSWGSVSRCL